MSELLAGNQKRQDRVMLRTGTAVVALTVAVAILIAAVPKWKSRDIVEITLSTPVVGQGIREHSPVMLRGVVVGTVTSVGRNDGVSELTLGVNKDVAKSLNDSLGYDFRPANMLGKSVVNLIPRGAGSPLANGRRIERGPEANATMAQLLSNTSTVVNGVVTDAMVKSILRAAQYTNAMRPLIETGFVFTNLLVQTQTVDTGTTLRKLDTLLRPLPGLSEAMLTTQHNMYWLKGREALFDRWPDVLSVLTLVQGDGLVGPAAVALARPRVAAGPATEIARSFTDALSTQLEFSRGGVRIDRLLAGLQSAYSAAHPNNDGAKSVKLRVMLEPLPVFQSTLPPLSTGPDGTGGPAAAGEPYPPGALPAGPQDPANQPDTGPQYPHAHQPGAGQ
ncbi:MlaD family protein [Mycobacteroides abscessus]|uniref:MlaD family protein n=1 Tax=Mycobacteroides abscessus TaxID=36809 RepID=UPI0009A80843|nr:MlaD family protein [Mycobacteroides abscessus]MDO3068976.1 MlaD family protein [Mycobacteroides abscessus subsp. bolletii]SKX17094.1 virulence factor Mce family protein [Mycobacteroides abscessus subsp. bolletii]